MGFEPYLPDLRLRLGRTADPVQLPDPHAADAKLRRCAARKRGAPGTWCLLDLSTRCAWTHPRYPGRPRTWNSGDWKAPLFSIRASVYNGRRTGHRIPRHPFTLGRTRCNGNISTVAQFRAR